MELSNAMETELIKISLRRAVLGLIVLLIIAAGIMIAIEKIGGIDQLHRMVGQAGPWAPVVYIILKASTYVVAPLNGAPITITAGALFGLRNGIIYTLLGEIIGGSINFWLARLLGQSIVMRLVGKKGIARVNNLSNQLGEWRILLFVRIFLSGIYDFISYAAGLTAVSFRQYLVGSAIGGLFSTTFLTALGASLGEDFKTFLLISGGLGVLFLAAIVWQRRIWRIFLGNSKPKAKAATYNLPDNDIHQSPKAEKHG
jgi:uncharacterized membrane protein YdjX (TVP38/TMEM64 family)